MRLSEADLVETRKCCFKFQFCFDFLSPFIINNAATQDTETLLLCLPYPSSPCLSRETLGSDESRGNIVVIRRVSLVTLPFSTALLLISCLQFAVCSLQLQHSYSSIANPPPKLQNPSKQKTKSSCPEKGYTGCHLPSSRVKLRCWRFERKSASQQVSMSARQAGASRTMWKLCSRAAITLSL